MGLESPVGAEVETIWAAATLGEEEHVLVSYSVFCTIHFRAEDRHTSNSHCFSAKFIGFLRKASWLLWGAAGAVDRRLHTKPDTPGTDAR